MNKKIENLKEIEYYTNYNLVGEVILSLKKKYPDNEKIDEATRAMTHIGFYVQNLIQDRYYYDKSMSEYRADKTRAIERARRADAKVQELQKLLQAYKKKDELGI